MLSELDEPVIPEPMHAREVHDRENRSHSLVCSQVVVDQPQVLSAEHVSSLLDGFLEAPLRPVRKVRGVMFVDDGAQRLRELFVK